MFRQALVALIAAASLSAFAAPEANKASQAELEALRGLGPSLALRIVTERKKGDFKNWDDLIQRVRGVGPGSAAKLSKAGLTVADASFSAPAKAKSK